MNKRIVCIVWALCLLLAGCSRENTPPAENSVPDQPKQESSGVTEEEEAGQKPALLYPAEGGELRLAIQNPASLLPWQVSDEQTGKLLLLIYSPLMNQSEDGRLQPCLAESWSWSEDQSQLTIQLRQDVHFHDGQRLTASDVVYSIQQLQSASNVFRSAVSGIAHAEAVDEGCVRLQFAAPGRMQEETLVFPIVPWGYEEALVPVGTGPYQYDQTEPMREMKLKRYEAYFGDKPYITEITVYFVRDGKAVEQCFETTRTNLMQTNHFEWGTYANQKNLTLHRFESYETLYLEFNRQGAFGASLSNRQKVAYAIDASHVLRDAYWGRGNVTETLLRPASWYQGHTTKEYEYDAEKAQSIPAQTTDQIKLLYDSRDLVQTAAAETIREQLTEAGLTVTLTTAGYYDIALKREQMTLVKIAEKLGRAELLQAAFTEEEISSAAAQLDAFMTEELPVYNLFFLTQTSVTGYGIKGMMTPNDWNVFLGIEDLYMKGTAAS
ncbi:MAG: ABC transporter substrate-binding protein [Lachnospiraceae bacterium]|jgi:peptide/nickel transport system substrate-binding protein|nr:ABC transporter substrate-binding protein [Lachnospiraceae bacterium]